MSDAVNTLEQERWTIELRLKHDDLDAATMKALENRLDAIQDELDDLAQDNAN